MSTKTIITQFNNRNEFLELLKVNPGLIIVKFGAKWCGPCKQIHSLVEQSFRGMPDNVLCADIDIDENFDVYTFLKSKRMINGVPTIFCYTNDDDSFVPSFSVVGGNIQRVQEFFNLCIENLK